MNRKKTIINIFIIIIGGIIPFTSFSANETDELCLACGSTPPKLSLINDFTREILKNIRTIGTRGAYAGKHVPPSRFDSGEFVPVKKNFIAKSLRWTQESLGSVLGVGRIFLNFGTVINAGDSLGVLAQNRTILRDRQKLSLIEKEINNKKYELSVGGGRSDIIKHKNKENIEAVFQKYKELGIIDSYTLGDGSNYGDLLSILQKMNNNMKHLIGMKDNLGGASDNGYSKNHTEIKLLKSTVSDIMGDYNCTKRYACEQSRKGYGEEFKKIGDSIKNGRKSSVHEFNRANIKLVETFDSTKKSLEKKRKKIKEKYNKSKAGINNTLKSMKNRRKSNTVKETTPLSLPGNLQEISKNKELGTILSTKQEAQLRIGIQLVEIETDIKTEAETMTKDNTNTDISDITAYFKELSDKINHIRNNIIGTKESGLIKNLGELCNKQCSNISKTCY